MALIHTIQIQNEKSSRSTVSSTRKSENRTYVACLVATTTQKTLDRMAAERAQAEETVRSSQARLAELESKWGMTTEAAIAQNEKNRETWYSDEAGYFNLERAVRSEMTNRRGVRYLTQKDLEECRIEAVRLMVARGYTDPYDKNGLWAFVLVSEELRKAQWLIDHQLKLQVGDQAVISWHQSLPSAQKALGAREATSWMKRGDTVEIRTDIEVRETSKRSK